MLQVGGARLVPEVARRIGPALGCRVQQVFGMAEGLLNYTRLDDPDDVVVETQGRPLSPADEILVVGPDGEPVADGEPGELLTRGPYTIRGYYRAEAHNAVAFTADGFYRSGDVVRLDPSGNLTVEGRAKDLINRGGEKISAEEIENLLIAHPAVREAAAVAMPHPVLGEQTCAYLVLRPGETVDLAALSAYLDGRGVARFKWPERIEVVDALPVTNVGKVDKKKLRDDIAAKMPGGKGMNDALDDFYAELRRHHLEALWRINTTIMPFEPKPRARAWLWRHGDLVRLAELAGKLVPIDRGGDRRVLAAVNPGLAEAYGDSVYGATATLWGAVQYLGPHESAPAHRHSPSALRFVVEGSGAWTTVDGERLTMAPGDLVLTPAYAWHDHQNDSDEPMSWFDGLDLPLACYLDAQFFEFHPSGELQVPGGGSTPPPAGARPATRSAVLRYRVGRDRSGARGPAGAARRLRRRPHPVHQSGHRRVRPADARRHDPDAAGRSADAAPPPRPLHRVPGVPGPGGDDRRRRAVPVGARRPVRPSALGGARAPRPRQRRRAVLHHRRPGARRPRSATGRGIRRRPDGHRRLRSRFPLTPPAHLGSG